MRQKHKQLFFLHKVNIYTCSATHGDPLLLDSTRCEHAGGLGALIAANRLGWVGKVKVTMDNSGVTARMADKSSRGAKWREERMAERPLQWLKLNDPDIHAEAAA